MANTTQVQVYGIAGIGVDVWCGVLLGHEPDERELEVYPLIIYGCMGNTGTI